MEINALRSIKDSLLDSRIKCFISDGNIKIRNFINNLDREPKIILRKDPGLCMHKEDIICAQFFNESNPIAKQIFDDFLHNTSKVLHDVKPGCGTQINESFDKLFAFRASYSLRTAITILDWNEQFYTFEVLKRINSKEAPYTVFLQSIKHEQEAKRKKIEIRATERWKLIHKQEKWKKIIKQHQKAQVHIRLI